MPLPGDFAVTLPVLSGTTTRVTLSWGLEHLSVVYGEHRRECASKQEYVQAIYHRYRGARRPEKQRILDEFCEVTGRHRKHATRLLNSPAPGALQGLAVPRARRRRRWGRG
jgi:hypothetical protein